MTGAIVLAAGYSSRMGAFKPLLKLGGVPALALAIRSLKAGGADEVGVVTGYNGELLRELIASEGAEEICNPDYGGGMFTSVRAGVRRFSEKGARGALLLPADCPLVPAAAVRELLAAADGEHFAVPAFRGKKGHPLWIPSRFFREILAYTGDMGLKGVTGRYEAEILRVEVPYEGVVLDMDEPEDYQSMLRLESKSLAEAASGRRFILLRHGETELHSGKIYIGRYDAQLSERGLEQARLAAGELAALKPEPSAEAVYCGSLKRARASAQIIAEALRLPLRVMPCLDEISLGSWEGRLIEDIKRECPDEYKRRGENILSYKIDAEAESFYDLQRRVERCLWDMLALDKSRDMIIVSHLGVIKCLYASLHGRDIEWAFSSCNPKKGDYIIVELGASGNGMS